MKYTLTVENTTTFEVTIDPFDFTTDENTNFEDIAIGLVYGDINVEDHSGCKVEYIEDKEQLYIEGPTYDKEN